MEKTSVLIIDDELVICELLNDLLKDEGYDVRYVTSGVEGMKMFPEGGFDMVMCDLKMPDADGIEVLRKFKEVDPEGIFIVMTGYPTFETLQSALRLGGFDYVAKPLDIKEVLCIVNRAVDFRNLTLANKKLIEELKEKNIELEKQLKQKGKGATPFGPRKQEDLPVVRFDEIFSVIVDRISRILELEVCSILLCDKETGDLAIKYAKGLDEDAIKQTKIKPEEEGAISGWVAKNQQALLVEDVDADPRFAQRSQEKYYSNSLISVPLIVKDEVIGVINVNNKKSKEAFKDDDLKFLKGVADGAAITVENVRRYMSLEDSYISTVLALASALDEKDHYIKDHSENVASLAGEIASQMGLADDERQEIKQASRLHDLGNIGVHDSVLSKPGKLTPEEIKQMQIHASKGAEILRPLVFLGDVVNLVEQHHERYDGTGYPHQLKGEEIKLGARIIALADSYEAMITDRPYRKALSHEQAIEEIKKESGKHFDPKVVEAFIKVSEKSQTIK